MCFGSSQTQTTNTNSSYTPASYLTSAAQNNLNFASNLQSSGFSPYTGQQVANFAPLQENSFTGAGNIAGAVTPALQLAGTGYENYMAGAQNQPTISPETIASQMSPYMNQYVNLALQPQLTAQQNQQALNQQEMQGQATAAGAFGDPRAQMLQSNQQLVNNLSNEGLVGNAYNAAFNTAIGAGAQDVANNLQGQVANSSIYNTGLGEQLTGANAILGANTGATTLENTLGAQQTAQSQAGLNAAYNQWLMAEQYPFQTTSLINSTLGAAVPASPSSSTSQATTSMPNNSGYGMLGSLLGTGMNLLLPGSGTLMSGLTGMGSGSSFAGASAVGQGAPMTSAQYYGSGAPMTYLPNPNGGGYIPGYAEGGRPEVGKPAVVGEKGPELFVPDQAGTVVPYHKIKEAIKNKHGVSTDGLSRQLGIAA